MKRHSILQGTDEWFEIRRGRFTASKIYLLEKQPRSKADKEAGKLYGTAEKYVKQKVQERLSGVPEPEVFSKPMEWGKENEPLAIKRYEEITGNKVWEVGFVTYGDNAGASTDGLVSFDGIIEVKCPYSDYMSRILEDPFKNREYYLQMQMGMLCTGRKWCDYIIYDPRMPKGQDIVIQRIGADEAAFEVIKEGIQKAERWAQIWIKKAKERFDQTQKLTA